VVFDARSVFFKAPLGERCRGALISRPFNRFGVKATKSNDRFNRSREKATKSVIRFNRSSEPATESDALFNRAHDTATKSDAMFDGPLEKATDSEPTFDQPRISFDEPLAKAALSLGHAFLGRKAIAAWLD
jgi:hypothetical protein